MSFKKVNENLYLFMNDSYFDVNVGAIALPNKLVMIDSGVDKEKLLEFRRYVEKETGKEFKILFLSHLHGDHTSGADVFSDCKIIASEYATEKLKKKSFYKSITATDSFDMNDDGTKIIFKQTGGHTQGSSYIYCPNYKILFAGDNLFENMFPYGHHESSDPDLWVAVLEKYLDLDVELFITGHQGICDKQIIKKYIDFIQLLKKIMQDLNSKGKTKDEIFSKCMTMDPFQNTIQVKRLETLKTRTIENWYKKWIEK